MNQSSLSRSAYPSVFTAAADEEEEEQEGGQAQGQAHLFTCGIIEWANIRRENIRQKSNVDGIRYWFYSYQYSYSALENTKRQIQVLFELDIISSILAFDFKLIKTITVPGNRSF